jgi:NAD kinase
VNAGRLPPRAVVVTRPTEYEDLLQRHATREQTRFFLASRGQRLDEIEARHAQVKGALEAVLAAIPYRFRRALVRRADLDRFLFEPEDIVVAVGQDGLVANVAKYLSNQIVIGINPSPSLFDGVLVRHRTRDAAELLLSAAEGRVRIEDRTMAIAMTSDGQRLVALNEIFVGHRTHQSARYSLAFGTARERHSSSGIILTTGTGATGWARSIARARRTEIKLPKPTERALAFFVREAFPSVRTGADLIEGVLDGGASLRVTSEMNEGGVVFGDGIEDDRIDFHWGQELTVGVADVSLRLLAA